jgi:hypothetical protein
MLSHLERQTIFDSIYRNHVAMQGGGFIGGFCHLQIHVTWLQVARDRSMLLQENYSAQRRRAGWCCGKKKKKIFHTTHTHKKKKSQLQLPHVVYTTYHVVYRTGDGVG